MDGELDCSKSGTSNWKDIVAQTTVKVLNKNFKNPYDTSKSPVCMVETLLTIQMLDIID